ncbi:MAG: hypothetical protein L0Z53_15505, partial [Acidobacteriales bacterium]|nr:hypothetical protein [Terriglobales bacterium]
DEKFLRLEARLLAPYLILRDKINEIINWLALPTVVGTLIKGNVLLASLGNVWGLLQGIFHKRMTRALTLEEEAAQQADRERYKLTAMSARVSDRAKNGLLDEDKKMLGRARDSLLAVTGLEENQLPLTRS